MRRWMVPAFAAAVLVGGCGSQVSSQVSAPATAGQVRQTPMPDPNKVVKPRPFADETAHGTKPSQGSGDGPSQKPAPPVVAKKMDPSVLGTYKLMLDDEQKQTIDSEIAHMKEEAAKGNKQAAASLASAVRARELVDDIVVILKSDGRYRADFGGGNADGSFHMSEKGVVLVPDQKSDPKAGMPSDVELVFDKAAKTLTADFQGSKMVFVKKAQS